MIIALSGMAQDPKGNKGSANSGKDTVADHLVEKHGFVKVALADPMKRFCMEVYDFTEEQLWGPSPMRNAPDKRYPRQHEWVSEGGRVARCAVCGIDTEGEDQQCYLTPRYALQQLGTEWGRDCYNDVWVNYALRVAKSLLEDGDAYYTPEHGLYHAPEVSEHGSTYKGVVIPDVRHPNENNGVAMVSFTAGIRVRIRRHVPELLPGAMGEHTSEKSLIHFHDDDWDYIIENDGTEHVLRMKVDQMMAVLSGRIIPYDDEQKDIPPFKRK
jgi:hypothetical protein